MRMITTLKQALTLYYFAAATLPLVLFSFVTLHYANDYLLKDVLENNSDLMRELRSQTDTFLSQRRVLLEHVANILYKEKLVRSSDVDRYLAGELAERDFFDAIYVVNRDGRVIHFSGRSALDLRDRDLSGNELYQRYFRNETPGWWSNHVSPITGKPSISFATVADKQLIVGTIGLDQVQAMIGRLRDEGGLRDVLQQDGDQISFALIDHEGYVIAHSDPEIARQQEKVLEHASIEIAAAQGWSSQIEKHVDKSLVEAAALVPGTDWLVWVGRDYANAMAPLFQMRNLFIVVFGLAVMIAILAVLITARRIMQPMRGLLENVRGQVAGGEPPGAHRGRSYREIDELSASFHRLFTDVQAREAAMQVGERRFRTLVNSVDGMVFEAELPGLKMAFVSERAELLTGFSPKEWLATPGFWENRLHPDDRQWAVEYRAEQSQSGHAFQYEYRLRHKNGGIVWVREMASVVQDNDAPPRLLGVAIDITSSKEAELSLQESEQRFRSLVEQAADAIFIHDQRGQLLDVNEQACRSLGYSRAELQGLSIMDVERIQYPLQFASLWNSVQRGGSLTFEAEHRRKDGNCFPVEVRLGSFLYQEQPMLLALVRDITDRKRALQALRESEERYRSVVSTMTEGVLLTDTAGIVVAANPALERIFGLPHNQLLSRDVGEVIPEFVDEEGNVCPAGQMPEVQTRTTGKPVRNALLARMDNGKPAVWLEINTQPIFHFGETGVVGVVTTFTNVTDRKEALEALRQSEEQVRLLLNSTAEGIFGLDPNGLCIFCNPAALRLLGYQRERDLLGRNVLELIQSADGEPGKDHADAMHLFQQPLAANVSIHSDTERFRRADGSSFDVEFWGHPILKMGEPVGAVVTFHDITERKRMQQQTIRNAQLASLGELAAGVAHEINNPVSGVINYAQILLNRTEKQGGETDLIERIIREGERIATIVRDMLFFAREGGGEVHVSRLVDLLQDAVSLSAAQLRKEGIALNIDMDESLPSLKVRAQQIQQLFLNLLSNARHALREKYPGTDPNKRVDISARQVQGDAGVMVRVVVKDYGTGIPEHILPRVMNPFVTTKPAGIGTGLGLSISHEIVKQHGGDIRIESQEGDSTSVIIDLPVVKGEPT